MNIFHQFQYDLRMEFTAYNRTRFRQDLLAGITVAAVALPLALAFGLSSGATAVSGLVTAIISGLVIGAFSGASFQISGPTGAMSAILITLAAQYGMQGILIACFLAGVLLFIAGLFKLGRMIHFIPSSVITGFTSGIAVVIALGQIDNFFRVTSHGELAIEKLASYFTRGFSPHLPSACIGGLVVFIMLFWPKKWDEKLPSSLASLILVVILNEILHWDLVLVAAIPQSLMLEDRLHFSIFTQIPLRDMVMPAISIAALAMIESLLCGAAAGKMKHEKLNADRELLAQGLGNMLLPFLGGIPATAAIARTSVGIKAGGQTRLTGMIHALVLMLSMFVLAPLMSKIPLAALAGVLMVTAWRMNDWQNIRFIIQHRYKSGMAKLGITLIATVMLDLTQAIIIGVLFSSFLLVARLREIEINISEIDSKRLKKIGIELPLTSRQVKVAYLTGPIFFTVVEKLLRQLSDLQNTSVLILSMRGVPDIDLSGVQAFSDLHSILREHEVELILSSVQPKVLKALKRGDILDRIGEKNIFSSAEHAIISAYSTSPDEVSCKI